MVVDVLHPGRSSVPKTEMENLQEPHRKERNLKLSGKQLVWDLNFLKTLSSTTVMFLLSEKTSNMKISQSDFYFTSFLASKCFSSNYKLC
ncbi:hypothetical protein CHUAL_013724 [Chamberlinius hualienensis]